MTSLSKFSPRKFSPWADFTYGVHSGIPLCCVVRFLWRENVSLPDYMSDEEQAEIKMGNELGFFYVPCIFCLAFVKLGWQRPAKLHRCKKTNPRCVRAVRRFQAGAL